jgi:hypothetical protein
LINAAQFACCELEVVPDLEQLGNLRSQAEKMAKEQQLYKRKSPNWCRCAALDLIELCAFR